MLGRVKLNNLQLVDDLKLFAKAEKEIESLTTTVQLINKGIGMGFGIEKCCVMILKGGGSLKVV